MTWDYTFTPSIWPSVFTVILLVVLGAYSVRRRSVPGALPFAVACLFGALWVAGAVMEQAATDVSTKIFWIKFQALWQLPAATAVTCFILEYVWPGRWLTRRNVALISVPSLLVLLSVATDDLHHLFWRGFHFDDTVIPLLGPINWAAVAGIYGFGLANLIILGGLFVRSPQHRWPVAIILMGQIGARVLYTVEAVDLVRSVVPLDVITLGSLLAVYAVALFGFAMFDPVPLARRAVMVQMRDGVLVLDPRGQITSLNSAAQEILKVSTKRALGRPARDLLPSSGTLLADLQAGQSAQTQVSLEGDEEARDYLLEASALTDWRGLVIGCLLLLRDVTEERRAQAEALQRRWTEATLQERELLAEELHDGLAQTLGFLNLQAQAAQAYLREGHEEAAQETLDRLAQAALEVQGDTRELIGNLLAFSRPSKSLCSAIRRAVARFEDQSGLTVTLEMTSDLDAVCGSEALPPAAGVQLLRIVQEALTNVRKHAGSPSQVNVGLKAEAGQMQLTIIDNGVGFELAMASAEDKHFGLEVMHQRAARMRGQMSVLSAPGWGTRVEVLVPLAGGSTSNRKGGSSP